MEAEIKLTNDLIEICKQRIQPYACEGFLLGGGNSQSKILFVGEAPGRQELIDGVPFSGKAGKVLDQYFEWLGIAKSEVYITSVVRSRPYKDNKQVLNKPIESRGNRTPTQAEIRAHAPLLDALIEDISPSIIVTLGGIALRRLTNNRESLIDIHGRSFEGPILRLKSLDSNRYELTKSSYTIFPTFHPASVFYNQRLKANIEQDMQTLKEMLKA
ncbi:uracil-DNA glycosylase [Alkalicoccobacillus porphyridii]|uniref:Uracil-DNA glycosylase n=1 Tax=Alkalicoccobacillus porphyridii TaxID=2597270 RepID=A0A553ZXL4_9BACI|nr:uracil-DNA glycosylase [Alkalicoccobacillus porphyridii]TSB46198.1 uracil-DNA glycosylase [Alkalicoccobacillus porphyridii]